MGSKLFLTRSSLIDSMHIFEAIQEEKLFLLAVKLNLTRQTEVHALFFCLFVKRPFTFSKAAQGQQHLLDVFSTAKNRSQQCCRRLFFVTLVWIVLIVAII